MNTNSSTATGNTLGKILAGAFLHDFREVREGGKSAPQMIQVAVGKLKKYLGQEDAKAFFEATEDQYRALLFACLDQIVLDQLTSETKEILSKLNSTERIMVETFYLKSTGQDFLTPERNGRWAPPLWKFKSICRKYLELSPTEVAPEDLLQTLKDVFLPMLTTLREHVSKSL